uniref:Uncharacterized protein n=1 Tax=Siphoviridae sp. ct8NQ14 TaxID=2825363 RepID=A0A8S5PNP3_9CAUD|nr:MAG TPA: hypothetical protein [Siphoviridae sp. ct8NQ14]
MASFSLRLTAEKKIRTPCCIIPKTRILQTRN